MSKLLTALGGQGAGTVAAASVAVAATVGAGVFVYQRGQIDAAAPTPAAQVAPVDEVQPEAATTAPPRISTFRLDPDGQMLVAGRGEPGWDHEIRVDEEVLAAFQPETSGEFVQFLSLEASPAPRVLSLAMRSPEGQTILSEDEIIIAPQVAVASAGDEAAPEPQAAEEVSSQAVLISNADGVEVVQPPVPGETPPEVMASVALDTISYSQTGEVQLAGRAAGEGFVRIYLDNAPVTSSRIAEDGAWRTELPQVDTRVYTLRVDAVDEQGQVTSRVETPFKREEPEVVARQDTTGAAMQAMTVQPGNTLWAISRERYGEGTMYLRIFEANKDRIRDPDLIYPGQVFDLPVTD
jgi:nucleoid-associated protein YgaU